MPAFRHQGRRLHYDEYGEGSRPLILVHGLLMNGRMYEKLAPEMAARGNRVLCIDLMGHGRSDRPRDMWRYSMPFFGEQVVALMDHLELDEAIVGGTSLGANVALEVASLAPDRLRGLFVEMPVLDNALLACALAFTPMLVALTLGEPVMRGLSAVTKRVPRTTHLVDIGLDWVRQEPGPSAAVLQGLFFGRTAPHRTERRTFEQPALIIGHPRDPVHPFSDAGMLAKEMPNARLIDANSILEWRLRPQRLNEELGSFLDECWRPTAAKRSPRQSRARKAS
jgi:pimeloyl-ACP methyl ester carboxylesterase